MNYIGSKQYLQNFICTNLASFCGRLEDKVICDLFGGMGSTFSNLTCKELFINDVEFYSYVILKDKYGKESGIEDILNILNNQNLLKVGKISKFFSTIGDEKRNYFTPFNAKRIDGIREKIEEYKEDKNLYFSLLASLLNGSDLVANTASVYGAYLKKIKKSAEKQLFLTPLKKALMNAKIFNEDGLDLLKKIKGDILYLDPPYNHRQYGLNYHVLNAIAKYEDFSPRGVGGYGEYFRSKWCQVRFVKDELAKTLQSAKFDFIALSYSEDGLLAPEEIGDIMGKYGRYERLHVKHDALRMQKRSKTKTIEYLHLLEKR